MSQVQHIVVVDDEQPAREMVGDYLRMHGFGVSLCDGGAALRKAIAQQVPDLIGLDRNLFRIPTEEISETKVLLTMLGGTIVHESPDAGFRAPH